jgi:hypothetical protein
MKRIGKDHVSFFGERAYDNSGKPIKPTYNWLAMLGYQCVRDIEAKRHIIPIRNIKHATQETTK